MLLEPYIKVYPKVLSLKTVSTIVKTMSSFNFEKATIGENFLNENIRKVSRYSLSNQHKSFTEVHWHNFLFRKFLDLMNFYLYENNLISFEKIVLINQIDLLKYTETGHYDYHVDDARMFKRTLSAILFLNNDYKGGELSFKNSLDGKEKTIEPQPGSVAVWPSNLLFPHTVKPVTEGTRYSVVAWGC